MNFISRVIVWLKRLFRSSQQSFEVWDFASICIWLDKLQQKLEENNNVIIVIPEVVIKQLSEESRKYFKAEKAHKFLLECENTKLIFAVISQNNRKLANNEQILSVVAEYYNRGYNVTLVTCSNTLADNAKSRRFSCNLLAGINPNEKSSKQQQKVRKTDMSKTEVIMDVSETEKKMKCSKKGKDVYIFSPPGIVVYDKTNKRRIGKNGRVLVRLNERVVCDDVEYIVKTIEEEHVILKKI